MNRPDSFRGSGFVKDNLQWMIASLALAFGLWIIAVLQTDPVQEREFLLQQPVEYQYDADMLITTEETGNPNVTIRAPRSVLDSLRSEQISVFVDLHGRVSGDYEIDLQARLDEGIRGEVVRIDPPEVDVVIEQVASRRIPIRISITQEPPSGYSYPPPTCTLSEVTARGPAASLDGLTAVARLNLTEERNPVTISTNLLSIDSEGSFVSGVVLEPHQVDCDVEISQREGVTELSVVPEVQGFPPAGYIYEGYEFEPRTVIVTGSTTTIRELNGVVSTEAIDLTGATSNFERTVSVELPEGVRLLPVTQTINVSITIGTVPGSRQYEGVTVEVEALNPGLEVELLPNIVTVLVVGPQPILEQLNRNNLRVVVNLKDFVPGTYQVTATASIIVEDLRANTTVTVQPSDITATISEITDAEINEGIPSTRDESTDSTAETLPATPIPDTPAEVPVEVPAETPVETPLEEPTQESTGESDENPVESFLDISTETP